MRVKLLPLEGEAEPFDPADPAPFTAIAGSQLVEVAGGVARVRTQRGVEMTAYPGWFAVRPDGSADGEVVFASPECVEA
jgi:hypothetical protein